MSGGAARVLASIQQPVETETPYGGRVVSYEAQGSVWLACGARRRRERSDAGQAARDVEVMKAECRRDPRVTEGRVLRVGGADWAIVTAEVDADRPGRMMLGLERAR